MSLLGRKNYCYMSTFEVLILIAIFCFLILGNEVNSLIGTFLLLVNFTVQRRCFVHLW